MKAAAKRRLHISWRTRRRRGDYAIRQISGDGRERPGVDASNILGKEMTPQEFLADKDAQEASRTRAKGGEYLAKYGPEGAAAAWFAGEKGMNDPNRKDTLGTHVAEYRAAFQYSAGSRAIRS